MLPLTMLITFSWNSLWGEEHRLLLSCWQSLPSQGLSGSSWLEKISGVARYDVDDIVLVHCWSKKFLCLFRVFMAPASNYYYFLYFYWWIPEHCQVLQSLKLCSWLRNIVSRTFEFILLPFIHNLEYWEKNLLILYWLLFWLTYRCAN